MLTQEDNLILQTYYTSVLLAELKNNNLINSTFFDSMSFKQPVVKSEIKKINVDNQGTLLMVLYAMLVVPKEIVEEKYSDEYDKLNVYLENISIDTSSNYPNDMPKVKFIRHIRNAIAHARVKFESNSYGT